MSPAEAKFVKMLVSLARTVRRGTDAELARVAADWEIELCRSIEANQEGVAFFLPEKIRETGASGIEVPPITAGK